MATQVGARFPGAFSGYKKKMQIPIYQVDAFTGRQFAGNPAAVCLLQEWLDDALLASIAAENNLSETAFLVSRGESWELRWFTPKTEVDLCGHATLAAAFVILNRLERQRDCVLFDTRSGKLSVRRAGDRLAMDFPARPGAPCPQPEGLTEALGAAGSECYRARDLMVVYATEEQVLKLRPKMDQLMRFDCLGVIVTAPGQASDFVSRFFAPAVGVPEDPVTGSAHTMLVPYWSRRLGKQNLYARQVSERGGELWCENHGDRITLMGQAVLFMEGTIVL